MMNGVSALVENNNSECKKITPNGHPEKSGVDSEIVSAIFPGLLSKPKYIPSWYQYDTTGSRLFDRVAMEDPNYHIYRAESEIFQNNNDDIASCAGAPTLVELGAGSSTKTLYLIKALLEKYGSLTFIPIDIAKDFIEEHARIMMDKFEGLTVAPFGGEYVDGIRHLKNIPGQKLIIFIGTSIGNIPMEKMATFLLEVKSVMGPNDGFLVSFDRVQDKTRLLTAYSNPSTEGEFTLNVLTRLNQDFHANLKRDNFTLHTNYVIRDVSVGIIDKPQYIQKGLKSRCQQKVKLGAVDLDLTFEEGEVLYCHEADSLSIKWTWTQFEDAVTKCGFYLDRKWTDAKESLGLVLMRCKAHEE